MPRITPAPPLDAVAAARLLDALSAWQGVICAVGAGGKKSTLYRLMRAHQALATGSVLLTTTVHTAPPPEDLARLLLVDPAASLPAAVAAGLATTNTLIAAAPSLKPGRLAGLPPAAIDALVASGVPRTVLVKADGARMRLIKAPHDAEPVLPRTVTTLLPVVSAQAFGRPLDERIGHRIERLCELVRARPGELLSPQHVARLLTHEQGALQQAGAAQVVPVITMVDTAERRAAAELAARLALAASTRFDRVILAAMTAPDPIVALIR